MVYDILLGKLSHDVVRCRYIHMYSRYVLLYFCCDAHVYVLVVDTKWHSWLIEQRGLVCIRVALTLISYQFVEV